MPAEKVAAEVVREVHAYLESGVPVGRQLADQLLLPLALAGGGRFLAMPLSKHALTNIEVIRKFLPIEIKITDTGKDCEVIIGP